MKKTTTVSGAAVVLLSALLVSGCGSTNNFGASVDIGKICAFEQGTASGSCQSNPVVSLANNSPLFADLEFINRMNDTSGTGTNGGLTVRLATLEVEYRTPSGQAIPLRREQVAANVAPGTSATVPLTLLSFEQMDYVQTNRSLFPRFPFQVNLLVTVKYDTTGAASGSVQRLFTVELTE